MLRHNDSAYIAYMQGVNLLHHRRAALHEDAERRTHMVRIPPNLSVFSKRVTTQELL